MTCFSVHPGWDFIFTLLFYTHTSIFVQHAKVHCVLNSGLEIQCKVGTLWKFCQHTFHFPHCVLNFLFNLHIVKHKSFYSYNSSWVVENFRCNVQNMENSICTVQIFENITFHIVETISVFPQNSFDYLPVDVFVQQTFHFLHFVWNFHSTYYFTHCGT